MAEALTVGLWGLGGGLLFAACAFLLALAIGWIDS